MIEFDVILPVYINDDAGAVRDALSSIFEQTVLPRRVLVVCDGPVSETVESVLLASTRKATIPVVIDRSPVNQGLGMVLSRGILHSDAEYVARMDADDFSVPTRFEKQVAFLEENPIVDVVGGHIVEYDSSLSQKTGARIVPLRHDEISSAMDFRNPFNHVTVLMRRSAVLDSGNYQGCPYFEDYYLWLRMRANGAQFANVDFDLANVRGGAEMISRRGGWFYAQATISFLNRARRETLISRSSFLIQMGVRLVSSALPGGARGMVYRRLLRR